MMSMTQVEVRRMTPKASDANALEADLHRARVLAKLLDSQFKVAGVRFGLEGLLGVIPVAGDAIGAALGLYPVWLARKHRLGKGVTAKMAANLAVELAGGAIPWVGDLFDVAFKANLRNLKLLEKAIEERESGAR
jgi:uncharacterized protein DUF4112